MNRRDLLKMSTVGVLIGGSGCIDTVESVVPGRGGCPDPGLEEELPYEFRDSSPLQSNKRAVVLDWAGAILITGENYEIDLSDVYVIGTLPDDLHFTDDDRQWIKETDFSEEVVIVVQTTRSGDSSDPELLGVERDEDTVHVYSCLADPGYQDDWMIKSWMLRVPYDDDQPESASAASALNC